MCKQTDGAFPVVTVGADAKNIQGERMAGLPTLNQVIQRLQASGSMDGLRLAENLEMDLPGLQSSHKLAHSHGNNVEEALADSFVYKLGKAHDPDHCEWMKQLHRSSHGLDGLTNNPHFIDPRNAVNRCNQNRPDIGVRYMSARIFHSAFVNTRTGSANMSLEDMRIELDIFFENLSRKNEAREGWLGLPWNDAEAANRLPRGIWITPWEEAPHRQLPAGSGNQDWSAREVVRRMGLPGFSTPDGRRQKIGLIAVACMTNDVDLYKPTVLDAMDSYFFFPAPTAPCHGITHPLANDLAFLNPDIAGQGVKEYICKPFKAPTKRNGDLMVKKIGYFL